MSLAILKTSDFQMPFHHRCSIIANPKGDAWNFACKVYEYLKKKEREDSEKEKERFTSRINHCLEEEFQDGSLAEKKRFAHIIYNCLKDGEESLFELNPLHIIEFPDKEFKPKIEKNIRGSNCFFIHDSNLDPARWLAELIFVNDALRNSSAHEIINVLPYLKFSRQDRKDESRTSINSKDIAKILNHGHTRVLTIDVHNDAIQGFYDIPFDNLPSFPVVVKNLRQNYPQFIEDLVILGPDEGSLKRVRKYAEELDIGIAIVDKFRKVSGKLGESLGILGNVRNKNVLEIDDIVSSGDTCIEGANAAINNGARNIWFYGTHGLFTKGYERVAQSFGSGRIFIGDTIKQKKEFFEYPNFGIISFTDLMGEASYRINKGDSLSELFQ